MANHSRCSILDVRSGRGIVLLEVILAVALFVAAAAVVTSSLQGALSAADGLRRQAKAVNLAETVLSRLSTGELKLDAVAATAFDEAEPEWTYEIAVDPIQEDDALKRVTVTVRHADPRRPSACRLTQWMLDLSGTEAEGAEGAGP